MIINEEFMTEFFKSLSLNSLYNEISFQFELGKFIEQKYKDYKVEYERNITNKKIELDEIVKRNISLNKNHILLNNDNKRYKKEIDIFIYKPDLSEKYAIELKFPSSTDGYTNANKKFIEDIEFVNFIKDNCKNFKGTYCINIARHKNLYSGGKLDITRKRNDIKWIDVEPKQCLEITDSKKEISPKYYIYKNTNLTEIRGYTYDGIKI